VSRQDRAKQDWATGAGPRGPKPRSPLALMAVGDVWHVGKVTPADCKRVARNVSQYGIRHDKGYRCSTDLETREMTVTRLR
jgi:hypothetical protein